MSKGIYLRWRGQTTGPYTLAQVKQALADNPDNKLLRMRNTVQAFANAIST